MTAFTKELLTRIFVFAVLLCAFSLIYAMGCAAVFKNALVDNWRAVAE